MTFVNSLISTGAGSGDMTKSVYDTNNDGTVDAASAVAWTGVTGKPSTFTPSTHTHPQSDITNLTTDLAAKQAQLNGSGFVKASGTTISYDTATYQPQLSGTGFVKIAGTGVTYDNSTYLTTNQSITYTGDVTGSGTTAVTLTIGPGKVTEAMHVFADNTTNDVSITKHGFTPKAPNDTNKVLKGDGNWGYDELYNANTGDVTANAADTYLTGSSVSFAGTIKAKTKYRWRFSYTKTAAGTATPIFNVRIGTAGTTSDTARCTFTGVAQTGATDTGWADLEVIVRSVGVSGQLQGVIAMHHKNTTTGLANAAQVQILQSLSATFDTTTANTIIGVSCNPGSLGVWTFQVISVEAINLV